MLDQVEAVDEHVTQSVRRAVTGDYRRGYQPLRRNDTNQGKPTRHLGTILRLLH